VGRRDEKRGGYLKRKGGEGSPELEETGLDGEKFPKKNRLNREKKGGWGVARGGGKFKEKTQRGRQNLFGGESFFDV